MFYVVKGLEYKMNERIIKLIGDVNFKKIKEATVCVVGLGGVGCYAVEGLVRSGIEHMIIVDYDTVDVTNLNRQIIATNGNIGCYKTDEMENRIRSINPNCKVTKLNIKLDKTNIQTLFSYHFEYLIDACDTILVKEELIKNCLNKNITIISSMGTGNKLNPEELQIIEIKKTSYDPIAKKIRKYRC